MRSSVRRWATAAYSWSALLGLAPTVSRAAPGCDAIIYFDAGFGGENREVYDGERFVGPHWNDQVSSIRVLAGNWIFYRDAGFQGDVLRFGPGAYPTLPPRWNDQISSFQCVGGTGEGPGYAGDDTYVYQGQTYGWYDDGWNGAGFYVIGLQRARGRGFGGREGAHGWRHHDRRDRDHRERDDRPGSNPGGPRRPGPGPGVRPPHGGGGHPPPRPHPGGGHPPPRPHPHGGGHPAPRPHPGGGHPAPHPHAGGGGHRHR